MWCVSVLFVALWLQAADPAAEGLKALEAGNYAEAASHFKKAVEADPKDYGARFHLALADSLLGKDTEAIAGYRAVLELKSGLFEAELNLGMVLTRDKRPCEAAPLLEAAVAQRPTVAQPNFHLAEAHFGCGDLAKAERFYRAAAELDPSLRSWVLKVAARYENAGDAAQAMRIYGEFPEDVGSRERMGELLIESGKPADAIPHLEWVAQNSPTAATRLALATAYSRTNQPERAAVQLEQAVAAEPGNLDLRMRYGRVLRDLKRYPAAAAEFYRVVQAKQDSVDAWNELAGMLILTENYPQALAALDRLKALGAETPSHFYLRAIMLDKSNQQKPALESYRRFLALSEGKFPDEEFKARQRVRILEKELKLR